MDFDNLDYLCTRIVTGSIVIEYKDSLFIVKDPTPKEKLLADHWYEKSYDRFLLSSALTNEEVNDLMISKKLVDPGFISNIDEIESSIEDLKSKKLLSTEEKKLYETLEKKKKEFYRIKNNLTNKSADYLATIEKYKYFIFLCTYTVDEQRYWKDHSSFLKEDEKLINHLLQKAYFEFNYDEKYIRRLARNEPWRSTWIAYCKGGCRLFDNALSFMTDLQKALISWSIIYDGIYDNPEKPPQHVIDDDKLCDEWLKNQSKERGKKNKDFKNNKINSSQEVFIMVNSLEEAQRVYEDNSLDSKSIIKNRNKVISQQGVVKEGKLPDVQVDLKMRKNRLEMSKGKKK